jgi:hypothetical protein
MLIAFLGKAARRVIRAAVADAAGVRWIFGTVIFAVDTQ